MPASPSADERAAPDAPAQRAALVYQALNELPERDRTILTLRHGLNGRRHSRQEVADKLGIDPEEVGPRVREARQRLRQTSTYQEEDLDAGGLTDAPA